MEKGNVLKLVETIILCQLAGLIGSIFNIDAIPKWYSTLEKPFFNPPNWIFAQAWTTLFVLIGISLYLVWSKGIEKREVKFAMGFFGIQLFPNVLWSALFFGLKSPPGRICRDNPTLGHDTLNHTEVQKNIKKGRMASYTLSLLGLLCGGAQSFHMATKSLTISTSVFISSPNNLRIQKWLLSG